jgi:hypothetical protein
MQNSVAIYSRLRPCGDTRTPAPWIFRRGSAQRVDGLAIGLWLRHGRNWPADSLTLQKCSVSASVSGQDVESKRLNAISDEMTENPRNASCTCVRRRMCVRVCVCHVVRLSDSYIYIYRSITYTADTGLTPADSDVSLGLAAQGLNRCLSGWRCARGEA